MSAIYATIKLAATHNKLTVVKSVPIAAGNRNSVFVKFALRSNDWLLCEKKYAVFNGVYSRELNNDMECEIPYEVMANPGEFTVGLYGINDNVSLVASPVTFLVDEGTNMAVPPVSEDPNHNYIYDGGDVSGNVENETNSEVMIVYDGGGVHGYS